MARTNFKNPFTGQSYAEESACLRSMEPYQEQLDKLGVTARQAVFNSRNRFPIGTKYGTSAISGKPTEWNEKAGRYQRFASEAERQEYRQIFLDRMRRVHGKDHLLNDPQHQRRMLASRSISGTYTCQDGTVKTYTGQEELALIQFLDKAMEWQGADIHMPAPQTIYYLHPDGKQHFYVPDAWIETLNLMIEVKGEMHNGYRSRDLHIETAKDESLKTTGYRFVKVEDRNYQDLVDAMLHAALEEQQGA